MVAKAHVLVADVAVKERVHACARSLWQADNTVRAFFSVHDVEKVGHVVEDDKVVFDEQNGSVVVCEGSDEFGDVDTLFDVKV